MNDDANSSREGSQQMPADVRLPNGMRVACLQRHEVRLVNREIESYFSHGFHIEPGDTVFDVGANIGLFSLAACARCDNKINAYAFEPVRAIFDLLGRNIERHALSDAIEPLNFGLSSATKAVPMAFYPKAPVLSTAFPDEPSDIKAMKEAIVNSMIYLDEAPLALKCLRWLPRPLRLVLVQAALKRTLKRETVACEMRTISEFVRDRQIARIDYLKIDVERAEMDVLDGVEPGDWPKIERVVVEVHDIDDRLRTIVSRLGQRGLQEIVVSQAPTLVDSNIFVVFATRPGQTRRRY